MVSWKNPDELSSFKELCSDTHRADLKTLMSGEHSAERVADYKVAMSSGLS